MSCLYGHHRVLKNGVGKCSVPMWCGGLPAGFCDEPAYGKQTDKDRADRKLRGEHLYVPTLACPRHGGPREINPDLVGVERATWQGCPVVDGASDGTATAKGEAQ